MVTQRSRLTTLLSIVAIAVIAGALLLIHHLESTVAALTPALESYPGAFPWSVRFLLGGTGLELGLAGGCALWLIGFTLQVTRPSRAAKSILICSALVPVFLLGFVASGQRQLVNLSLAYSRADVVTTGGLDLCSCSGAFRCLNCLCGCSVEGKVQRQIFDGDGDKVFDALMTYTYDEQGNLYASSVDKGIDGVEDQKCNYTPPCSRPRDVAREDWATQCQARCH